MTSRASVDRTYIANVKNEIVIHLLQILWWQIKQEQKKQFVLLFHLLLKVMEYRGGHDFLRSFKR